MKCRLCPYKKFCHDAGNCEDCDFGKAFDGLGKKIKRLEAKNRGLREENAVLKKLLGRVGDCTGCVHDNTCASTEFICDECELDCICKSCRDNSHWKWKGTVE